MRTVCIEPVVQSGALTSFTMFDEKGDFLLHQFSRLQGADPYLKPPEKFTHVCFDVFKSLPMFGGVVEFFWDVKILYELMGHRCNNLIDLGRLIFPYEQIGRYVRLSEQVKAHLVSYKQAKIDITGFEAVQLLPEDLMHDLYRERSGLINALFLRLTDAQKEFYKSFYDSVLTLYKISSKPLNIDLHPIEGDTSHFATSLRKNTENAKTHLWYKAVGAKTGRLGFRKNTFNLYNLPKPMRSCIVASPGCELVEVDFKSFQPRIAIFSTDSEGFKDEFRKVDDIYGIFPGDRAKNKLAFLAWMYGKTRIPDSEFEKYAWPVWELRDSLAKQSQDEGYLQTRWGRYLYNKNEPKHVIFQNFITATEVDCVLQLMNKLVEQGYDVLFPYHDAIVCEVKQGDSASLVKIREFCENFLFSVFDAKFPVGVKVGKTFGAMNEV